MSSSTDFSVYRCPDPNKVNTDLPWFNMSNVCPCDPKYSNITGRGYTPCTFGIQTDEKEIHYSIEHNRLPPLHTITNNQYGTGMLYENNQYVPPQLTPPRPLARIGQQFRSSN